MSERPLLNQKLDGSTFRSYYYLKEELVSFCRDNGLPTSGSKEELTERIAIYLDTGKVNYVKKPSRHRNDVGIITENTVIEPNFVCSEKHRAFFRDKIGNSFSFPVAFQKWLKTNTGKSYAEAIEAYYRILEEKKKGKTVIDRQFEYNTYIRDFFEANPGKNLQQAICCWNYKKARQGHNCYENIDLEALKDVP